MELNTVFCKGGNSTAGSESSDPQDCVNLRSDETFPSRKCDEVLEEHSRRHVKPFAQPFDVIPVDLALSA